MRYFKLLSGYKTYIAAIMIAVVGIQMMMGGDYVGGLYHIVGNEEFIKGLVTFLEGVGLGALRGGVQKVLIEIRNYLDYQAIALPPIDGTDGETSGAG